MPLDDRDARRYIENRIIRVKPCSAMAIVDIDFEWPVAVGGYEVHDYGPRSDEPTLLTADLSGLHLDPKSSELERRRPLADEPYLFLLFADTAQHADGAREFASRFGLLLGTLRNPAGGEAVWLWLRHIQRFRLLVDIWQSGNPAELLWQVDPDDLRPASIAGGLSWREGRPRLALRPNSLLSAMRLQFFQAVAELKEIKACDGCGKWFERGPGKARRAKSRFCSDQCRFDFHNARKGIAS
jgi:hypothetical protein